MCRKQLHVELELKKACNKVKIKTQKKANLIQKNGIPYICSTYTIKCMCGTDVGHPSCLSSPPSFCIMLAFLCFDLYLVSMLL